MFTDIMRDDITVKPLAAAINPDTGTSIYALQCHYPRIIHAEVMTHRVFSRNASSSRAIPVASMLAREEMFIPKFKHNKPGMQPAEFLSTADQKIAEEIWVEMADFVMKRCQILADKRGLNIAKQWVNRPLEWFGYIDVVITSTDWANWDYLRDHGDAQDEACVLARKMSEARNSITPKTLKPGEWMRPYIRDEDIDEIEFLCDSKRRTGLPVELDMLKHMFGSNTRAVREMKPADKLLLAMSAARCCRVSYAKHDGEPSTLREDVDRCLGLVREHNPVHASPFEHQASMWQTGYNRGLRSNFRNFLQLRKLIPFESVKDAR